MRPLPPSPPVWHDPPFLSAPAAARLEEVVMTERFALRPAPDEYAESFAGYVADVPAGSVLRTLETGIDETIALLKEFGDARGEHRYAPGKWSVKEVTGHLIDAERVFAYRLLRFARGDRTPLQGFEEDDYVREAHFERRTLSDLVDEFRLLRAANLGLFRSLDSEELTRRGTSSGKAVSVRALLHILAGHEIHHRRVLRERYRGSPALEP
jgi:uncharacterized damage-inducible protein DinB